MKITYPSIDPHLFLAIASLLVLATTLATASAQQRPPKIWDIQLGTPVGELPEDDFVDPACGTNGGTPGLRLGGFLKIEKNRPPPSGGYQKLVPLYCEN